MPVPHYGVALSVDQFHSLAERLRQQGVQFVIEPHLRFPGEPVLCGPVAAECELHPCPAQSLTHGPATEASCLLPAAIVSTPNTAPSTAATELGPSNDDWWHAGMPGEQHTMFFYDPSGNALEFKAMTSPENLFAKYRVE